LSDKKEKVMVKLSVSKLIGMNLLVLTQEEENTFFVGTPNKILISIPTLSYVLKFLIQNGYMSSKVLEGILSEYYTERK
jgi:hypothetical protein